MSEKEKEGERDELLARLDAIKESLGLWDHWLTDRHQPDTFINGALVLPMAAQLCVGWDEVKACPDEASLKELVRKRLIVTLQNVMDILEKAGK